MLVGAVDGAQRGITYRQRDKPDDVIGKFLIMLGIGAGRHDGGDAGQAAKGLLHRTLYQLIARSGRIGDGGGILTGNHFDGHRQVIQQRTQVFQQFFPSVPLEDACIEQSGSRLRQHIGGAAALQTGGGKGGMEQS